MCHKFSKYCVSNVTQKKKKCTYIELIMSNYAFDRGWKQTSDHYYHEHTNPLHNLHYMSLLSQSFSLPQSSTIIALF